MDRAAFEAACRAEGFDDIQEKSGEGGFKASPHTHDFEVRGLVLDGEFTLVRGDESSTYGPGQTFDMAANCEHAEHFGDAGVRFLIARRGGSAA